LFYTYLHFAVADSHRKAKVAEKEAETHKKIALSEVEKNALVRKILMQQMLTEKDSFKMQKLIDNEMYLAQQRALVYASNYRYGKHYYFFILSLFSSSSLLVKPKYGKFSCSNFVYVLNELGNKGCT
jgi:hypothetical protein